jgi:glutamine amidotransferase
LKGVKKLPTTLFRPIGTTDSEAAFCWLMDQLSLIWNDYPSAAKLDAKIADLFAQLQTMGVFNALLSDGRSLYASCGKRLSMLTRRAPFGRAALMDEDFEVDFSAETTPRDVVTILATRPLTRDEAWEVIEPGTSLCLRGGEIAYRARAPAAMKR